jgi:hypothetical protein
VASLDPAPARERLLAALESMEAVHLPPALVFAGDAALDLLRAHGIIRNLFWLARRGCATRRSWRSRSPRARSATSWRSSRCPRATRAHPISSSCAGATSTGCRGPRTPLGWKASRPEAGAEAAPDARVLPGADAAAAGDGAAFRHLVSEVEALRRARKRRTAYEPGWRADFRNWRDNVAERAYGLSGLGAVLPLLPEPGRRSFGFVLPLFVLGGVERVVMRQAAALRERGWRPHLFVLGEQRIALSAAAREAFESVNFLFGMGETDSDWPNAHFGAEVAAFGKGAAAADALGLLAGMDAVLNTHTLPAHALMGRLKGIGVRTFCGLHLVERTQWGNPLGTAHTALAYEHAYVGITVISEKLRRWCIAQGVPADKLHLIRNAPGYAADPARVAAAVSARRARPPGKLRALFLGRLDGQKGLDRLAAVAARTQHRVDWRVVGRPVLDRPVDLGLKLESARHDPRGARRALRLGGRSAAAVALRGRAADRARSPALRLRRGRHRRGRHGRGYRPCRRRLPGAARPAGGGHGGRDGGVAAAHRRGAGAAGGGRLPAPRAAWRARQRRRPARLPRPPRPRRAEALR